MSLAESFAALIKPRGCPMAALLESMSPEDRADTEDALSTPAIPGAGIERALRAHGFTVAEGAVRRHRAGSCSCP